jgi:hypothetical protein
MQSSLNVMLPRACVLQDVYELWVYMNQFLRRPYTINHVAQNCFEQHKFAHSRSSQSAPYTINHVAQHAMLRNMIDRVWAPLDKRLGGPQSRSGLCG